MNTKIPPQKLSYKKKTKEWRKQVIDALDKGFSIYHNPYTRLSVREKMINQNLYNGILDVDDMARYLNPYGIVGYQINKDLGHHSIIVPKVDVLVGEESKRAFDWSVIVTNPNAVSEKQKAFREMVRQKLIMMFQQKYQGEDEQIKAKLQEELNKLNDYANYSWKDIREMRASQLLKHYYNEQKFDRIFNEGFKDVLIMGEEIYECAIVSNEPKLFKLNPVKVHVVRTSNSSRIEDSDIIIIEDHWSPGKIIDTFHKDLKSKDVDHIMEYGTYTGDGLEDDWERRHDESFVLVGASGESNGMIEGADVDGLIEYASIDNNISNSYVDDDGNIRVLRVFWRSQRKVLNVKYYSEFGTEEYKIMDESYKIKKEEGETAETIWINEWWEGTKIGKDVYINMRPRPVQYNRMYNPSEGHPGIVGELYNTNQGKTVSLVSRMKSYQYMYDAIWDRLNKAIAKNMGKILEVDVAKIPNNWDVGKWLHYATTMGIGVVDSFKEGNKGAATGKLAGAFNTTGRVLDVETGSYIQHHINLLEYIKQEMSEIAGISKQREGNISNRETVGGVERSVTQSSHITEWWFDKHTDVKIRVLNVFLETAKAALRGTSLKLQNILDDRSISIFDVPGDEFAENDYGVVITSSSESNQLKQNIHQLAQAALQNQTLKFSDLLYIFNTSSLSDIRRRIEKSESDLANQQAQAQQAQQQQAQQAQQLAEAKAQREEAREDTKLQLEAQKVELDRLKLQLDSQLHQMELNIKEGIDNAKIKADISKTEAEIALKQKELEETIRSNKANERKINK